MAALRWKRGLTAGIALSFVLAAALAASADEGREVAAFTTTLAVSLAVTSCMTLGVWWLQRRSAR